MLGSPEYRELLLAEVALARGVASADQVAHAIQLFWARRHDEDASFLSILAQTASLMRTTQGALREAVDAIVAADEGDVRASLARARLRGAGEGGLRPVPAERYVGFEAAGEGGMGLVYMALDTEMNRVVAFKLVRPDVGGAPDTPAPSTPLHITTPARDTPASQAFEELKARFLQEAWVTGGLEHPGIVPVYELGQTPAGIPYYTMRFVRGQQTLRDALDALEDDGIESRLALIEPFLKLCDTVSYAHARGVLHRDLKPENVALGTFGEVVLLDWGLAKLEGAAESAETQWEQRIHEFRQAGDLETVAGALGTPGYMSPEAATGRLDVVDGRSDLYSLGVILFEILTGRLPFHDVKTFAEFLTCMLERDAPSPASLEPAIPDALSELVERCLARDPAQRPAGVAAFSRELRGWQAASALEAESRALLREARSSLAAAEAASSVERLRLVDRAMASLEQVRTHDASHPERRALEAQAAALREQGIAQRERAARQRVLRRAGVVALVVLAGVAVVIGALVQQARRAAERELEATTRMLLLDDARRIADLEAESTSIDPLASDLKTRVARWKLRAAELVGRLASHEASLAADDDEAPEERMGPGDRAALEALVRKLQVLEAGRADSLERIERLERSAATTTHPGWPAAAARVRIDPRMDGLVLVAQAGLVPLGPDPASGLEEFAHALSGRLAERDPATGVLRAENDTGIVFVLVPSGSFRMGAVQSEDRRPNASLHARPNEAPVRTARCEAFLIAKHECTQSQWVALTATENPSAAQWIPGAERFPVNSVSAKEADATLARHGLVLPSEVQWEYACRGGSAERMGADEGKDELDRVAWTSDNAGIKGHADPAQQPRTHPVGAKAANGFGLHDTLGNVWEWCSDDYADNDGVALSVGMRVFRGGCYLNAPTFCRPATREEQSWFMRGPNLGFRAARPLRP